MCYHKVFVRLAYKLCPESGTDKLPRHIAVWIGLFLNKVGNGSPVGEWNTEMQKKKDERGCRQRAPLAEVHQEEGRVDDKA